MSGLGIYVHWPYCAAKCPYCDFNSHVRDEFSETRWSDAILKEVDYIAGLQTERAKVTSIFFGGGTPSLMSGRAVARVLDGIATHWTIADDVEVTLEANPNSVEQERFTDYRAAGVNRVSIGVQSLDESALKSLGRLHGVAEARAAIKLSLRTFPRCSFDLIYARPNQTPEAWKHELRDALAFGTEHLSLYQLTIEPGTAYATLARQGRLVVPDGEAAAGLYDVTEALCAAAGLASYEVSNYANPGAESRHNLVYWRYGDYVGVGPGAHGRLTLGNDKVATRQHRAPEAWLDLVERDGHATRQRDLVPRAERLSEMLMMGLRLKEGVTLARIEGESAQPFAQALDQGRLKRLVDGGFLALSETTLAATRSGRQRLDAVLAALVA